MSHEIFLFMKIFFMTVRDVVSDHPTDIFLCIGYLLYYICSIVKRIICIICICIFMYGCNKDTVDSVTSGDVYLNIRIILL